MFVKYGGGARAGAAGAILIFFGIMTSAGAQGPTTEELTALALQAGKANFTKQWLEHHGSFFSSYLTPAADEFAPTLGYKGGSRIYIEARTVKFNSYLSTLSQADLANGLEWKGSVEAVAALVRTNENGKGWGPWRDGPVTLYKIHYQRNRGHWTTVGAFFRWHRERASAA